MKGMARANTNIALIKYWGKRDEDLILPMNSSLSVTLDRFYTTTSVQFCVELHEDVFLLNHQLATGAETKRVTQFLDHIRKKANIPLKAIVSSVNIVPTAAGFASSASGFAALAAAASQALGLTLEEKELTKLARLGSGSACRSIYGGFVEWQKGTRGDGEDSYAKPILREQDWKISILSVLVHSKQKKTSSRDGMKTTVKTSPFYTGWIEAVEQELEIVKEAISTRDFPMLGKAVEANALKMHATMLGADPPIIYWQGGTIDVMHHVHFLRESGIPVYFTIDAGPNVKVLCLPQDEKYVKEQLSSLPSVKGVFICHPGSGVEIYNQKE